MKIAAVAAAVGIGIVGVSIWRKKHRSNPTRSKPKKRAARRSTRSKPKQLSAGRRGRSSQKLQFARQTAEQFLSDASVAKTQAHLESLQRQLDAARAKGQHDASAEVYMRAVAEVLRKKIKAQEVAAKSESRAAGRSVSPQVSRAIAPVVHETSEREILAKYRESSYETLLKYLENIQKAIAHGGPQTAQMKRAEKNIKKVLFEKLKKNPSAYRKNPTRFDRCVRAVKKTARRTGYPLRSAEGVCAAAGRRRYGKKKFQQMAAAGRRRRNPPLMEGSAAADLQQAIAPIINRWGKHRTVRYSETGNGDLRVTGSVSDYPIGAGNPGDEVGFQAKHVAGSNTAALHKTAARYGFRMGYADGEKALLFRKL